MICPTERRRFSGLHRIGLSGAVYTAVMMLLVVSTTGQQQESRGAQTSPPRTNVVLLGTGTPIPDPDRSGPATAIVVGDSTYLVDFGPGVIRRAQAAVLVRGVTQLEPGNLRVAFVTHLHSDHTAGYSDLIFTGWTSGRSTPLEVYGPTGLNSMTDHILKAYQIDIETRTNPEGNQRAIANGWKVNAHEIKPGVIYKDTNVTVTAFATKHAMESYGYRFDTPDRRIVISGDTSPTEETIKACSGCDILIHEAQTLDLYEKMPERLHSFVTKYHTTTAQLATLAVKARPKLLVVYHTLAFRPGIAPPKFLSSITASGKSRTTEEILQDEISSRYSGQFVIGHDLDVY